MKISLILSITLLVVAPSASKAQEGFAADRTAPAALRAASSNSAGYDLGAVLAKRRGDGLTVMAVTPGGHAERLKLRAGDRLLSINGVSLDTLSPASAVQQAVGAGGRTVRLEVARGDRTFVVDDRVQAPTHGAAVVAPRGCGYVSNQGPTPSLSENVYPALITKISGASTPRYPVNRHLLEAGRQALVVAEGIPPSRFTSSQLLQRQRMLRQLDARAYKVLIIDVEPGMKYYVGAQLLPQRMGRQDILDNEYWQPVLWKEVSEPCR